MILELLAGHKTVLYFMPFHDIDENGKLEDKPTKDKYAIHGGKVRTEKQIRRWASEYGYTIKNIYQQGDFDEDNLLP